MTPGELAERLGVADATVSVMVKRMLREDRPLIERISSPTDRRSVLVALSHEGWALLQRTAPGHFARRYPPDRLPVADPDPRAAIRVLARHRSSRPRFQRHFRLGRLVSSLPRVSGDPLDHSLSHGRIEAPIGSARLLACPGRNGPRFATKHRSRIDRTYLLRCAALDWRSEASILFLIVSGIRADGEKEERKTTIRAETPNG